MLFSEKRRNQKLKNQRVRLLNQVYATIEENKRGSISLVPGHKNVPIMTQEDLDWLEKAFDGCIITFAMETRQEKQQIGGWVTFGTNPTDCWEKHLEMMKGTINIVKDCITINQFIEANESIRIAVQNKYKVQLPFPDYLRIINQQTGA